MTARLIIGVAAAAFVVYVAAIIGANALVAHFGLVDVGIGLVPAGTAMIALTWPARDVVQQAGGRRLGLVAIVIGAALSYVFSPTFAIASGATLLCSETLDWVVFSPLRKRHFVKAVTVSSVLAGALDTWLFLWLAGLPMPAFVATFTVKAAVVLAIGAPAAYGLRRRLA